MKNLALYPTLLVLIAFLALSASFQSLDVPVETIAFPEVKEASFLGFASEPKDNREVYILITGILTSKRKEKAWYYCGERLPRDKWYITAKQVAEACVSSARMYGVDPVGQLATWQQESRLDPCAIGPHARKYAIRKKLLKRKRTISYKKEEVLNVVRNKSFKSSFHSVDLGIAQLLHPYFTRGALPEEVLSLEGAKFSAQELSSRAKRWKTKEPWNTWPGKPSRARKANISWWVYTVMEIDFFDKELDKPL